MGNNYNILNTNKDSNNENENISNNIEMFETSNGESHRVNNKIISPDYLINENKTISQDLISSILQSLCNT